MPPCCISSNKIRIIDFDGSLTGQKNLISKFATPPYTYEIIDFRREAPYLRHWATRGDLEAIKEKLSVSDNNVITLYGSGDFHHISIVLIEQFTHPISVLVFDHHPDWDSLPPQFSCGSWVNTIVGNENVKKVILLGPSSGDLSWRGLLTASFRGLKNKKLKIFPYEHKPSRLFFRNLPKLSCFDLKYGLLGRKIKWDNLLGKNIEVFFSNLLCRIPTDDVYISIDKDCLTKDYALTNWEEGPMPLEWLLTALNIIKNKKNIVGLDITGEHSPVVVKGWLKRFVSYLDHPKQTLLTKDLERINNINESTNLKILGIFC
ncbi:MAG: hypothetical protein Q8O30_07775 [Candidatus Omnitrophota bacterium]|nr:hypothetical protein [Candidatus Omnitrophota bacterium]